MEHLSWYTFFFGLLAPVIVWRLGIKNRQFSIGGLNLVFSAIWLGPGAPVITFAAIVSYFISKKLSNRHRLPWLVIGIVFLLLPLVALRFPQVNSEESPWRTVWLNATLAFFCLQSIGALLDIYWNRAQPPQTMLRWLSFSLFFPSLLAGPVLRWNVMDKILNEPKSFESKDGYDAMRLLGQGLFKKMVFSAPFLIIITKYFSEPLKHGWITAIGIAFLLRYFLWAEISSHTDWARGFAKLLGYNLPTNFYYPFQTLRLAEFWRRWHSTISAWFNDYVLTPTALGPLRRIVHPTVAVGIAIISTFMALGLWHGLTISFLTMGVLKGTGLLLSEWSWRRFEKINGLSFKFYRLVLAPILFVLFLILPTLLLRTDLETVFQIFSVPDHKWMSSWARLTETWDGVIPINRVMYPYFVVAIIYEALLWWNRMILPTEFTLYDSCEWDFASLPQLAQNLILAIGFIVFLAIAEFQAVLRYVYVSH